MSEQDWARVSRVLDFILSYPIEKKIKEPVKLNRPPRRKKTKEYEQLKMF